MTFNFKFCTTSISENNSSKHSGTYLHTFTSEVLELETASGYYLLLSASTSVSNSSSETCEGDYLCILPTESLDVPELPLVSCV